MKMVRSASLLLPLLACASEPGATASPPRSADAGAQLEGAPRQLEAAPRQLEAPAETAVTKEAAPRSLLPPLANHEWLEPLSAPREEVAKLSVPNGAAAPRPVMIGLHGGGDRAEWSCAEWRGVTSAYPFIICPHGSASRTYWDTPKNVMGQLDGARAELVRGFPGYVAEGPVVLAGFSSGTTMALTLLQGGLVSPEALVLVEGSYENVGHASFPALLKAHRVRRLLLVCTTRGACTTTYREALPRIARAGIDVRLNLAGEQGHGFYPGVTESLRRDWPWLVSGLAGWEGFEPEPSPGDAGKTLLP